MKRIIVEKLKHQAVAIIGTTILLIIVNMATVVLANLIFGLNMSLIDFARFYCLLSGISFPVTTLAYILADNWLRGE